MVDCAREEFLARARLAEQKDCRRGLRDALRLRDGALDCVGLADDARESVATRPLFAQKYVLCAKLRLLSARPTRSRRWFESTGFCRKSCAPSFIACTASSIEPYAVIKTTGTSASAVFDARRTSSPEPLGMRRSVRTSRKGSRARACAATRASSASATV